MFSLQGIQFLNSLLCFNEELRLSWPEVSNHQYLYTDSNEYIPLKHVELVATCDVESNYLGSVNSASSSLYAMSAMNSYRIPNPGQD
jgi:hypothetical protein